MNIIDEMRIAALELALDDSGCQLNTIDGRTLQKQWDEFLVWAFFHRPSMTALKLRSMFTAATKCSEHDFDRLHRTPSELWQLKSTVVRFVSAYLPPVGKMLWDATDKGPEGIRKFAALFVKHKVRTLKAPGGSSERLERNERARLLRDNKLSKTSNQVRNAQWDNQKRSEQWGVCK